MKAFIAVKIPESLYSKLSAIQDLFEEFPLLHAHTYHITLEFLGDIKEDEFQFIKKRLESFSFPAFKFTISKLGVFPSLSSPKVLWVSSSDTRETNLFFKLVTQLQKHLFREVNTTFQTHISLARIKDLRSKRKLIQTITNASFSPFSFTIEKIIFYESKLTNGNSIYNELFAINLA